MNKVLFDKVKNKEKLAVITDINGNIIWECEISPVSALYRAFYKGELKEPDEWSLYANQAGLAIAIIAPKLHITKCFAYQLSACGLPCFQKNHVFVKYEELIPMVKSSKDETMICPVELFLSEHGMEEEQWLFLEEKFNIGKEEEQLSCSLRYR